MQHQLLAAYDDEVILRVANRRDFCDSAYATWFVRSGSVSVEWGGRRQRIGNGMWFVGDMHTRRTQRFEPGTQLLSIRICPHQSDIERGWRYLGMPTVFQATQAVNLLPAAERLVTQVLATSHETPGPTAGLAQAATLAAAHAEWMVAWLSALQGAGVTVERVHSDDLRLRRAMEILKHHRGIGRLPHADLHASTGWSRAQLDRCFHAAFGMTAGVSYPRVGGGGAVGIERRAGANCSHCH